ncbi:IS3 family transposase [Streptomyces sp. 769]|uniref:IS3 family transposase n=1 Tax=Streptomyces sp. 769 TaxID=1262452 RepID=UPI000582363E|nr:IS3 family transposase [Streptomyces sp. 769]AJC61665.1 integrase component [Streptomyces sp. 769]
MARQRQAQDEAISEAHALFTSWPEVRPHHAPEVTVVPKRVPGSSARRNEYDGDDVDAAVTVQDVVKAVELCGAVVSGPLGKLRPTRQRSTLCEYIDGFYNSRRTQERLGSLSPIEFEEKYYAGQATVEPTNLNTRQPALAS